MVAFGPNISLTLASRLTAMSASTDSLYKFAVTRLLVVLAKLFNQTKLARSTVSNCFLMLSDRFAFAQAITKAAFLLPIPLNSAVSVAVKVSSGGMPKYFPASSVSFWFLIY